jgi:phosphatidylserine/phosphatidylglycerophosphate/cardiolipin synthase-like enzyme
MAVAYAVSFGRRWSLLEHLILVELAKARQSVTSLAKSSKLPQRLVIESLINLLRAGWIEVRTPESGVFFGATDIGKRRAVEKSLPVALQSKTKWISLCAERLTGAWLRADDLQLVHEKDLPPSAEPLAPLVSTYDTNDGTVRNLLYLDHDESFDHFESTFRPPARLFARFEIAFDTVPNLPGYAPLSLSHAIQEHGRALEETSEPAQPVPSPISSQHLALDTIQTDDIIVGGAEHLALCKEALAKAKTHIVIHSCFLDPHVIESLLADFAAAARRKVHVDLLWGLRSDPEDPATLHPLVHSEQLLDKLGSDARERVRLSPLSSGSHAKIILYDDSTSGVWETVVSSCNFLSSYYNLIELSLRSRSQRFAANVLVRLIAAQQPPSGGWSPVARRLDRTWDKLRQISRVKSEVGEHSLSLIADDDHYACITMARDNAQHGIAIGCDLYGAAAETSVLVPMERAVELGREVQLFYRRPSRYLTQEGRSLAAETASRRLSLTEVPKLHGKFVIWDQDTLAISSFNWMSTIVLGTRARGAELGVLAQGPGLNAILSKKLEASSGGAIKLFPDGTIPE